MFGEFLASLFHNVTQLLAVNVPGFSFSFLTLYTSLFVISILLSVLSKVLGGSSTVVGSRLSNRKPKISESRKGDIN